ncbi:MAG: class I SAM-dependent methyltransferase [Anaerolineae bacterium]
MNHGDHCNLLRPGIPAAGGTWGDFGAGSGAFTLALADLLGASASIIAIDQQASALRENEQALRRQFSAVSTHYIVADFTHPLELPPLDGLIMANSLHFHSHKEPILRQIMSYLKPGGQFILVEYNADTGNQWVPYPLSYPTWIKLAESVGLIGTHQLATYPSRFLREIYSAGSQRPEPLD